MLYPDQTVEVLRYFDIHCRKTFGSLFYVKGDPVSFVQRFETGCIDTRMMNKYIWTIFLLDEAIALAVIEPFYSSFCQNTYLPE